MNTKNYNSLLEDLKNQEHYMEDENEKTIYDEKRKVEALFDRKLVCPVCDSNITVRSVKSSSIRILSRDSDFMIHYKEPNPMFYDVWVCPQCGYAAISAQFNNINDKQIKLIREKICSKWHPRTYPPVYDIDIAIERYKLALLSSIVKDGKISERALLCLKLAWLNRIKKDEKNEKKFMSQALKGFIKSYESEIFPIAGLDEPSLTYLIGELYRRLDDNTNALIWFGRVLSNTSAKNSIKDLAREQKYIIYEQRKNLAEHIEEADDRDSSDKKGFWKKLFNISKQSNA
ncbi:MAG: DUF2225 domain-containing protein [Clostridiaceae bacterium]|nr:DUF2225 domain-containing protein [Clostridiaceae bacterium]